MRNLTDNINYLVNIRRDEGNHNITANAQAVVQMNINNSWVNLLQALGFSGDSGGIVGAIGNGINALQIFSGNTFLPEIATSQVWRGSQGLEIQTVMRFDAVNDAQLEVVDPIKSLISMYMPKRSGGMLGGTLQNLLQNVFPNVASLAGNNNMFLEPPGPTPMEFLTGSAVRKLVTITIGRNLVITGMIPTQLQYEMAQRYDKNGLPISAQATCSFISYTIPDRDKVLSFFNNGGGILNLSGGEAAFNTV